MTERYYPVIPLVIPPREMEGRGTRRKFWVLGPDSRTEWLLKFPRPDTGEHWAEKIAAEIGQLIDVDTAHVELARSGDELATICRTFLSAVEDLYEDKGPAVMWFHGSEFLELAIPDYDVHVVRSNRAHNVKNIIDAVERLAGVDGMNPMPGWDKLIEDFASYALLDGLIGNADRHHENWMVAYVVDADDVRLHLAQSFDHASSLGRELLDERREQILSTNGVLRYLRMGQGGVFVDGNRRRAPPPLRLAQLLCRWRPGLAGNWFGRLNSVSDSEIRSIIERVPPEFMSEIAREFAYRVVVTSKIELLRSIR